MLADARAFSCPVYHFSVSDYIRGTEVLDLESLKVQKRLSSFHDSVYIYYIRGTEALDLASSEAQERLAGPPFLSLFNLFQRHQGCLI